MRVELLEHTKLSNSVIALRNAWQSYNKGGNYINPTDDITEVDVKFLDRIINKNRHETGAEFLTYIFKITNISIGNQNQLVRHRIGFSYVVKSTRYCKPTDYVLTGNTEIDVILQETLDKISKLKVSNDILKYAIPQGTATDVVLTCNARSLKHFFELRMDSHAHFEIREMANKLYDALPESHKFLFEDVVNDSR
jgi:thymidylate synthase (FAD)